MSNGELMVALNELKVSLEWFDSNHEQLIGLALQSILQAYTLRLGAYVAKGHHARVCGGDEDYWEYNECLGYIRDITASFADDFPKLLDQVDQKLLDLTNERIKGVKLDPRREGETDMGYIVDSCGKRSIKFQAYRRADYPNASDVDAPNEHQKQFRAFKDNYVKVLSERLPYYQPALRIHLLGLRDQHELFTSTKIREPSDPLHAPAMLATLIEGKEDTSSDRAISHRYKITTGKEVALKPSPWTKWYTPQDPGKRAQLLIGDGYALADKTRNIWGTLRPENSVSEAPPVAKAEELLLAKITGHGIMRWPEPPMHPMV